MKTVEGMTREVRNWINTRGLKDGIGCYSSTMDAVVDLDGDGVPAEANPDLGAGSEPGHLVVGLYEYDGNRYIGPPLAVFTEEMVLAAGNNTPATIGEPFLNQARRALDFRRRTQAETPPDDVLPAMGISEPEPAKEPEPAPKKATKKKTTKKKDAPSDDA